MNKKTEEILKAIKSECHQRIIVNEVDNVINHSNLSDDNTLLNINNLACWLYIIEKKDLALNVCSIIDKIPFEGDFMIWENVQSVLVIESLIYSESNEFEKSQKCIATIKAVRTTGDEATIRKRQRILQRVLNGSLLHDKEIIDAQEKNNVKEEIRHRFLQFKRLSYMKTMGGSETYSIEYLNKKIKKEKIFLKEKIEIANF
jgi:hypothetical protein